MSRTASPDRFPTCSSLGLTNLVISKLPTDDPIAFQNAMSAVHTITAGWKDSLKVNQAKFHGAVLETSRQLTILKKRNLASADNLQAFERMQVVAHALLEAYHDVMKDPGIVHRMLNYRPPSFEEAIDDDDIVPGALRASAPAPSAKPKREKYPIPTGWLSSKEAANVLVTHYGALKTIWLELEALAEAATPNKDGIVTFNYHGKEVQMVFGGRNGSWYAEPTAVHGVIKKQFEARSAQPSEAQLYLDRLKERGLQPLTSVVGCNYSKQARQRILGELDRAETSGALPDADGVHQLTFGSFTVQAARAKNILMVAPAEARNLNLLGAQNFNPSPAGRV